VKIKHQLVPFMVYPDAWNVQIGSFVFTWP